MDFRSIGTRAATWFILVSVVAALALARDFFVPMVLAVFVAFALTPIVRRLMRAGMSRTVATLTTMTGVGAVALGAGWMLLAQLRGFSERLPAYRSELREKVAFVRESVAPGVTEATATLRDLGNDLAATGDAPSAPVVAENGVSDLMHDLLGSAFEVSAVAAVVFLLATVMLLRWEDVRDRFLVLLGESDIAVTTHAGKEASAKISTFLRRQILLNAAHGAAVGAILWIVGVPNPLVWGILAGLLRFVPYVGPIVGTLVPILVACGSSDGWTLTLVTAGLLVLLEIVTNCVAEPLLYGRCTGVSPLALLVSAAFWTWIWGPAGLVLSTPITVCLIVIGKHVPSLRFFDVLFGDEPALSRAARLYHRFLADDADEAWEVARAEAARTSIVKATDDVLLPALALVSTPRSEAPVDAESRERIGAIAHGIVDEWVDASKVEPAVDVEKGPRVMCLRARDAFDAVAARVLAAASRKVGVDAVVAGESRLLAETLEGLARGEHDVVLVSSVVPTHFLHVRTLCKRLLAADPDVVILVGLWGETRDQEEMLRRLPESPRIHVETSLEKALAWMSTNAPVWRAKRERVAQSA